MTSPDGAKVRLLQAAEDEKATCCPKQKLSFSRRRGGCRSPIGDFKESCRKCALDPYNIVLNAPSDRSWLAEVMA